MPVGTRGAIRSLTTDALGQLAAADGTRVEVMLGNTYHLMLRPGAETVAALGGLHRFTGWDGHLLTDSGGYQVFSLEPEARPTTASCSAPPTTATSTCFTPESAVAVQELLGADIQMVLDVCAAAARRDRRVLRDAVERTAAVGRPGAGRRTAAPTTRRCSGSSRAATDRTCGSRSARAHRRARLRRLRASAGCRWGRPVTRCCRRSPRRSASCPPTSPATSWGWATRCRSSRPSRLGVDMFDCVLPTRLARHGTLLTDGGRMNIKRSEYARRRLADRRRLPVHDVPSALARLPAPPGEPARAGRGDAVHGAQPDLDPDLRGPDPRRRSPRGRSTRSRPAPPRSGRAAGRA